MQNLAPLSHGEQKTPPLSRVGISSPERCDRCGKPIARIRLAGDYEAILHAEDFDRLNLRHRLYRDVNKKRIDGTELVYARIRNGKRPGVRLHTLVAELHGAIAVRNVSVIDHHNRDTLDNRWGCNLRLCSVKENNRNKPKRARAQKQNQQAIEFTVLPSGR